MDLTAVMNAAWEFTEPQEDAEEEDGASHGASHPGTDDARGSHRSGSHRSIPDARGGDGAPAPRGEGEAVLWEASFGARRLSLDDSEGTSGGGGGGGGGADGGAPKPKQPLDRLDSFGGKDRNKFPVIPESPKRATSGSHAGSPLRQHPEEEHSFGRNLVGGVVARLGRGVGTGASHLIPRPLFSNTVRVGIARDAAFCHYYRENLALLRECGADLVPFSPVAGDSLPQGCRGILFGGGYPESYAQELTGNRSLRMAITAFAAGGGVIYGECGGLMFLSQALIPEGGAQPRPMCLAPSPRASPPLPRRAAEVTIGPAAALPAGCRARNWCIETRRLSPSRRSVTAREQSGWFGARREGPRRRLRRG